MREGELDEAKVVAFSRFWVLQATKVVKPTIDAGDRAGVVSDSLYRISKHWQAVFYTVCLIGRLHVKASRLDGDFGEVIRQQPLPEPQPGYRTWLKPSLAEHIIALLALLHGLRGELLVLANSEHITPSERRSVLESDKKLCRQLSELTGVDFAKDPSNALLPTVVQCLMKISAINRYGSEMAKLVVRDGDREGFFVGDCKAYQDTSAVDECYALAHFACS